MRRVIAGIVILSLAVFAFLYWHAHSKGEWNSYEAMHAYFVRQFVLSQGNGGERMPRAEDALRWQLLKFDGKWWKIERVVLISTAKPDDTFAYISDTGIPRQDSVERDRHGPLMDGEKAAIGKLRAGEELISLTGMPEPEVLGAIRMQKSCRECHRAKEGALLGAFRYPLIPTSPIDETFDGILKGLGWSRRDLRLSR